MKENMMKGIEIEKVTLNIGVGEAGERLDKATRLLEKISNSKAVQTKTMKRIPGWGIRPKLAIGCKVTLRKKKAEELLSRLLKAVDDIIPENKFDKFGNFSFGIKEYIDIPGVEYDSEVGIIGLEVAVTLQRKGYRIQKRKIKRGKVPEKHKIRKQGAIEFMKNKFNIKLEEEEE